MRYITLWRKPDSPIDWDFYVSEDRREADAVIRNLVGQKVRQASTYELGPVVAEMSLTFKSDPRP
jgi:hypothetical protein